MHEWLWRFAFQGLTVRHCHVMIARSGPGLASGLPSPPSPYTATDDHVLKPGGSRSARFASQKLDRRGLAYRATGSSEELINLLLQFAEV